MKYFIWCFHLITLLLFIHALYNSCFTLWAIKQGCKISFLCANMSSHKALAQVLIQWVVFQRVLLSSSHKSCSCRCLSRRQGCLSSDMLRCGTILNPKWKIDTASASLSSSVLQVLMDGLMFKTDRKTDTQVYKDTGLIFHTVERVNTPIYQGQVHTGSHPVILRKYT